MNPVVVNPYVVSGFSRTSRRWRPFPLLALSILLTASLSAQTTTVRVAVRPESSPVADAEVAVHGRTYYSRSI